MTPFFMPTIGAQFRLEADLETRLFAEHRNSSLFKALGLIEERTFTRPFHTGTHTWTTEVMKVDPATLPFPDEPWRGGGNHPVQLPAGTVLQVDRIYLRKGSEDFDSLTFLLVDSPDERLKPWKKIKTGASASFKGAVRFWLKLRDIQGAMVSWLDTPAPYGFRPENAALHTGSRIYR